MIQPSTLAPILAHIENAMSTDATVRELAAHVTREQAAFLTDASDWLREIVAARPPIQPAREWRTPTECVKAYAANLGAGREAVSRKPASFFPKRKRR